MTRFSNFNEAELLIIGTALEEAGRRDNGPLYLALAKELDEAFEPYACTYCASEEKAV